VERPSRGAGLLRPTRRKSAADNSLATVIVSGRSLSRLARRALLGARGHCMRRLFLSATVLLLSPADIEARPVMLDTGWRLVASKFSSSSSASTTSSTFRTRRRQRLKSAVGCRGHTSHPFRRMMDGKRTPGCHDHLTGEMGCEPRPRGGLHVWRRRLTTPLERIASEGPNRRRQAAKSQPLADEAKPCIACVRQRRRKRFRDAASCTPARTAV
jgi:hypothetical protein